MTTKKVKELPLEDLVPEDDLVTDVTKVSNRTELDSIAQVNTRSILVLQRIRSERKQNGLPFDDVERAITKRQMRSASLIRQRQALQVKQKLIEQEEFNKNQLEPGLATLGESKVLLVKQMDEILSGVKKAKEIANSLNQRRLAAKLKAYEDALNNSLLLLNKLKKLEFQEFDE
jgi:hypothetical protein